MHIFEGFERGDLDLHFHQSIPPLSEGNLVDLDLGVLGVSPLCSSSLIPPLALVAVLEFESEGLEHFVCSCHCFVHRFVLSTRIRGS